MKKATLKTVQFLHFLLLILPLLLLFSCSQEGVAPDPNFDRDQILRTKNYEQSVSTEISLADYSLSTSSSDASANVVALQQFLDDVSRSGKVGRLIEGSFPLNGTVYLNSNTTILGPASGADMCEFYHSVALPTNMTWMFRAESDDGPYENIHLEGFTVRGHEDNTGNHGRALIYIQNSEGVKLRNMRAFDSDDAGFRVDGYTELPGWQDKPCSQWFGGSRDVLIEDCYAEGGYLGVELEGLVWDANIRNNTFVGAVAHNIRITCAEDVLIEGNTVRGGPRGIWLDRHRDITIRNNIISSSRIHIAIAGYHVPNDDCGVSADVTIRDNLFTRIGSDNGTTLITDWYHGSSNKYTDGGLVEGNTADFSGGLIRLGLSSSSPRSKNFTVRNNTGDINYILAN